MKLLTYQAVFVFFAVFMFSVFIAMPLAEAAIVPCGGEGDPCTFCDIYHLIGNIIDFILLIIIPLVLIALVVGAVYLLTSGGNPSRITTGKTIIWHAIAGLIIALIAWIIVYTIMFVLVDADISLYFNWSEIPSTC
jgi:hypothetical protein